MLEVVRTPIYHAVMTHEEKAFDLFWRNPFNYWRQMQELAEVNIAWDRGIIAKMKIDPFLFSSIKFGRINPNWRCYVVGNRDAQEYDASCKSDRPKGSYPTFDWYEDDIDVLEFYLKNPWGEDPTMYNDKSIDIRERAVKGQDHKVFITNLPPLHTHEGKKAVALLEKVNETWKPYCDIFVHRLYGFINLFGRGFCAGSFDGRDQASHGRVQLINGKRIDPRVTDPQILEPYLRQFGYKFSDMETAANRCLFNMQSAKYASNHFKHEGRPLKTLPKAWQPDFALPDSQITLPGPKD